MKEENEHAEISLQGAVQTVCTRQKVFNMATGFLVMADYAQQYMRLMDENAPEVTPETRSVANRERPFNSVFPLWLYGTSSKSTCLRRKTALFTGGKADLKPSRGAHLPKGWGYKRAK